MSLTISNLCVKYSRDIITISNQGHFKKKTKKITKYCIKKLKLSLADRRTEGQIQFVLMSNNYT